MTTWTMTEAEADGVDEKVTVCEVAALVGMVVVASPSEPPPVALSVTFIVLPSQASLTPATVTELTS
jgi:hypothetical protein